MFCMRYVSPLLLDKEADPMLLSKNTPDKVLKYDVIYENENTRLIILDVIQNYGVTISLYKNIQISEEIALFILEISSNRFGIIFKITADNAFSYTPISQQAG